MANPLGPVPDFVEAVLSVVETIPPGRVLTYGDVADHCRARTGRGGARMVGYVMARWGADVPWWRVVNAAGRVAPVDSATALRRLKAEGCPLAATGTRVDLVQARWRGPAQSSRAESPGA